MALSLTRRTDINPLIGIIAICGGLVGLLLIWWFVFWSPNHARQSLLEGSLMELQAHLKQLETDKQAVVGAKKQIETLNSAIRNWGDQFPEAKDADRIFRELALIAESYGLSVRRLKPWLKPGEHPQRIITEVGGYQLDRLPLTMLVEGRFANIGKYLTALKRLNYRTMVQEVNMRVSNISGNLYALVDMYLYFQRN